jgi:uncharacterized protein (TIGR04222 family)
MSDSPVSTVAPLSGLFARQADLGIVPGGILTLACTTVTAILAVVALALLTVQLTQGSARRLALDQLRPVELAVIHGGHQLALWVVAALLRSSGALGPDGRRVPGADTPACDDTLVPAVLAGIGASQLRLAALSTAATVKAPLEDLERRLQRLGMLTTPTTRHRLGLLMLLAEAVSALVLVELILTQRHGGPVTLLVSELAVLQLSVVGIVAVQLAQRVAGRRLLQVARASNPHLALTASRSWSGYGPLAVPLATALHGACALRASEPEFAAILETLGTISSASTAASRIVVHQESPVARETLVPQDN